MGSEHRFAVILFEYYMTPYVLYVFLVIPNRSPIMSYNVNPILDNQVPWFLFQAVSSSILKYRKLKVAHSEEQENKPNVSGIPYPSLLLEAWKPMSVGHKRR